MPNFKLGKLAPKFNPKTLKMATFLSPKLPLPPMKVYKEGQKKRGGKPIRHGHARQGCHSREYQTWSAMFTRCRNPNAPEYWRYGGRGIMVCRRWNIFENFLEDMGSKPKGMTLDRKDVNGHYEPSNCRWATIHEQNTNTRASLTDAEVAEIKVWLSDGFRGRTLAKKYNVSDGLISHIKTGRARSYVKPEVLVA